MKVLDVIVTIRQYIAGDQPAFSLLSKHVLQVGYAGTV